VRWTPARIKERRLDLGLSQQALADLLGVHVRSVTSWEAGGAVPRNQARLDAVLGSAARPPPAPSLRPRLDEADEIELLNELTRRIFELRRRAAAPTSTPTPAVADDAAGVTAANGVTVEYGQAPPETEGDGWIRDFGTQGDDRRARP
jgi:transcriptional regulator with XRE-family HTH domain